MFVVGPTGDLLYFNEPAEPILGRRFDETGELSVEDWTGILRPAGDDGEPLPPEARPVIRALETGEPAHGHVRIRGFDGHVRKIATTAFPLVASGRGLLGVLAIFWELGET